MYIWFNRQNAFKWYEFFFYGALSLIISWQTSTPQPQYDQRMPQSTYRRQQQKVTFFTHKIEVTIESYT